ncbi:MAG: molybdenum cofactor guanylyltransferase [Bacteroidetes bacterium]|nr:molybdenum cofactor guanylyltransferase [Bacteroidota bacterium]
MQVKPFRNFSAAILAGGKNSRFNGEQKSFLKLDNQYIIDKTINVLQNIFDEIIIVTNQTELYSNYSGFQIVSDFYKEIGPLGGIHAALTAVENDMIFIVSCDMPYLNETLINQQLESHLKNAMPLTIPVHDGLIEPLHGIYNKEILKLLENYIETSATFRIRGLFNLLSVNYFEVPTNENYLKSFTNINHPSDYQAIQNK